MPISHSDRREWDEIGIEHHEIVSASLIEEFIPLFFDLGEGMAVGQLVDGLRELGVSFLQDLELAFDLLPTPTHPGRDEGEIAAELPKQAHQSAHVLLAPPRALPTRPPLAHPPAHLLRQVGLGDLVDDGGESAD
jgi:hypothetical protein